MNATIEKIVTFKSRADLASLITIWHGRGAEGWPDSGLYSAIGDAFLELGESFLAYDVFNECCERFPDDLGAKAKLAGALLGCGSVGRANAILNELKETRRVNDFEVIKTLAATHALLGRAEKDEAVREERFRVAHDLYFSLYKLHGDVECCLESAIIALEFYEKEEAQRRAKIILDKCELLLKPGAPAETADGAGDSAPAIASVNAKVCSIAGSAALLLGRFDNAEIYYSRYLSAPGNKPDDVKHVREDALDIIKLTCAERKAAEKVMAAFKLPPIVVFCGHGIDRKRPIPRFPAAIEGAVRGEIEKSVEGLKATIGFSSAARGSDILFLETMLDRNGAVNIVLPYSRDEFIKNRVAMTEGTDWADRFDTACRKAASFHTLLKVYNYDPICYEYSALVLLGMAKMKAAQTGTEVVPLAVWNKKPGGTANIIKRWEEAGCKVRVIDISGIKKPEPASHDAGGIDAIVFKPEAGRCSNYKFNIKAMLFADAHHFSRLMETQVPAFVDEFLGAVAEVCKSNPKGLEYKNTWGDGLFFVFETVRDAGIFALELCAKIARIDWGAKKLPETLSLRIALHAGPVYSVIDPVTGAMNYHGTQVSYAARIEPVTPVGQVYASHAFAAIAAAESVGEFKCEYVGRVPFPKGFGTYPLFHLTDAR